MIKRDISLYAIEDFQAYVNQQEALGNRVLSVTHYVKNEDISRLVPFLDIIDLSAYLGIDLGTQALFEQLIPLYPIGINLIADNCSTEVSAVKSNFRVRSQDISYVILALNVDLFCPCHKCNVRADATKIILMIAGLVGLVV